MAAENSLVSGLAGRYAKALFDLAEEQKALDSVADDLATVRALLDESADLRRLVRNPLFTREQQEGALGAVLERAGVGDRVRRFVGLVARNRRLFALEDMIRGFNRLLAAHRGEIAAEVTSAQALDEGQLVALRKALAAALGHEATLSARVDPGLIGGLVVKVGSRMVDSSIRTKLRRLELAMKGVG